MILVTNQSDIVDLHGIRFFANAITGGFCGKWKNDTLAGLFDFVGADHYFFGVFNLAIKVVSDGLHSQKQCIIIPSVVAVARARVLFYLFAFGMFLIAFIEKLVPEWCAELRVMC